MKPHKNPIDYQKKIESISLTDQSNAEKSNLCLEILCYLDDEKGSHLNGLAGLSLTHDSSNLYCIRFASPSFREAGFCFHLLFLLFLVLLVYSLVNILCTFDN
jgi:hypothetical protein